MDEDEETKANQGGKDNIETTQEESKVGNDGGETTESEENNAEEGTDSPTKKRKRRKRKKSMIDDLNSDLKSQTPATNRKAVLESKRKCKEAEERAKTEDEEQRKRIRFEGEKNERTGQKNILPRSSQEDSYSVH